MEPEIKVGQIWGYGGVGYKIEALNSGSSGSLVLHHPVKEPQRKCFCEPRAFADAILIEDVPTPKAG